MAFHFQQVHIGREIFSFILFVFDLQQGAGNAEKFDYVSTISVISLYEFMIRTLVVNYSNCVVVGDELYEEVGRKRVCWFQQCYVSFIYLYNTSIFLTSVRFLFTTELHFSI